MDEQRAREILGIPDNSNHLNDGRKVDWIMWPRHGDKTVVSLDGDFTADDLEAIAWWMRNKEPD